MIDVKEPSELGSQSGEQHSPVTYTSQQAESPEARWTEKGEKVNLYSENVVKEPHSTEVVDRESIANLATTRRQWEAIFTSEVKEEPSSKPKKNPPRWQVRLPYTEKHPAGPNTVTSNIPEDPPDSPTSTDTPIMADTESAIEREIRLAMEREEMLRREQEERVRLASQRGVKLSSMESSTESELQPSFHELTEADRGSEFFTADRVHQQEDSEREESLQQGFSQQKRSRPEEGGTESIIEREIRLQREREAELTMQRVGRAAPPITSAAPVVYQQRAPSPPPESDDDDEVEVVIEEIPYEEHITQDTHEGESRIAQELRELREREEEVRLLRERMNKASVNTESHKPSSPSVSKQPSKSASAPQTPRSDKSPSVSMYSHNVLVSPRVHNTPPSKPSTPAQKTPTSKPETPIEREIRLARERENELRRAKGLPELKPEPQKEESYEEPADLEVTPRYYAPQPDTTMRRFASNRLQQEILDQQNREKTLRQEGKIISTSEEHIQPLKYKQVVAHDTVDGSVKRNFKTPHRGSLTPQDEVSSTENTPRAPPTPSTPRDPSGKKATGTGAINFSYREFAQTAESKIERELREMREREEELRKQRCGGAES